MTEAAATAAIDRPRLGGILLPLSERDFRLYWLGREVVIPHCTQCDGKDVGVVGSVVGRHSSFLRGDRRHAFLPELDSFFGDIAVLHHVPHLPATR